MNATLNARYAARLAALAGSVFFTLVMLAAVDGLAQHEHADSRIAVSTAQPRA